MKQKETTQLKQKRLTKLLRQNSEGSRFQNVFYHGHFTGAELMSKNSFKGVGCIELYNPN